MTGRDPLAKGNQHFSSLAANVSKGGLASQTPGCQRHRGSGFFQRDLRGLEKGIQDFFIVHAQGTKQDGHR